MSTHNTHDLERTSPKGQSFVGRCTRCGAEGLRMADAQAQCAAPATTDEAALLSAVLGPSEDD